MGCKGPTTYNACSVTKWNGNLSYPIQSGHGCIGCSEKGFWDNGPFYSQLEGFPGFGIESTADKVGAAAAVATLGGVTLHAITSNIRKHKLIRENMDESVVVQPMAEKLPAEEPAKIEEPKNGGDAS
jgi:hydrogenase small subunit